MAGLPGICMDQDSPEYKYTHHSSADALEAVKPEVLAQKRYADGAYGLLDRRPAGAICSPWPAEKTAKMLKAQHQDEMLKAFGLWPKEFARRRRGTSTELTTKWKRRTGTWRAATATTFARVF